MQLYVEKQFRTTGDIERLPLATSNVHRRGLVHSLRRAACSFLQVLKFTCSSLIGVVGGGSVSVELVAVVVTGVDGALGAWTFEEELVESAGALPFLMRCDIIRSIAVAPMDGVTALEKSNAFIFLNHDLQSCMWEHAYLNNFNKAFDLKSRCQIQQLRIRWRWRVSCQTRHLANFGRY